MLTSRTVRSGSRLFRRIPARLRLSSKSPHKMLQDPKASVMALDVGGRRIGVAIASVAARIAHPLTTLNTGETTLQDIKKLIETESVAALCVGLPRGLDGQQTQQTGVIQAFVEAL